MVGRAGLPLNSSGLLRDASAFHCKHGKGQLPIGKAVNIRVILTTRKNFQMYFSSA